MALHKRRTVAEERYEREQVWEAFEPKLDAIQTPIDAYKLVSEAPRPDSPGRRYYSNLGFFMQAFGVPAGASARELALYIQAIGRFAAAGAVKQEDAKEIVEKLWHAIKEKNP